MKLNGFLALGIVLIMLGGVSAMDILPDVTPPEYTLERAIPPEGQCFVTFGMARIECSDPESGIKNADFVMWLEGQENNTYALEFYAYRQDGGIQWEEWRIFLNPIISALGDYQFCFTIENNDGLVTQTDTMTFHIGPSPPPEHFGNLTVIGYYNAEPVVFEGWYVYEGTHPFGVSAHRTIDEEGYTWENLAVGNYGVHGIYNDIGFEKPALVEENQTTIVQLNFGGPDPPPTPPYTPPSTEPSKPFDTTLLFFGIGGLAIFYGFLKQKKVKP